ncbi:hypothetical protein FLA_5706 [Filimonas lacunae]|nr:hypothetical protein FLA_5706 [Filimonas lacunae]
MIADSRETLLNYCEELTPADFIISNPSFGRGSIRNLLVHIGSTYQYWIGQHALNRPMNYPAYEDYTSVKQCRAFFEEIDELISAFLQQFSNTYFHSLNFSINNNEVTATPLKLFTHVITHEFHHKGQILSLSRHLGYTPVDTDIVR